MGTIAKTGKLQIGRGSRPDETREFVSHGHAEMHKMGKHGAVMRCVFEPGWKWSEHVGPIAGTHSCEAPHLGHIVSGRMHVRMDDGTAVDLDPGDFFEIDPGHDAWVVGDEPCVLVDFGGYSAYAERRDAGAAREASSSGEHRRA